MAAKIGFFGYILIAFVVIVIIKIYTESDSYNLRCIISEVDGNKYCVRERNKLHLAADLLARTTQNLKKLVSHVGAKYPDRKNCQRLLKGFNPTTVKEILPTSSYTAYSENKGEKLAFCTTTTKEGDKLIDENTLLFVAIHELGHIMTTSIGHTEEFWGNFKFLLMEAHKVGMYKPVDYKREPGLYCGMDIKDNPYFDL